MNMYRYVCEEIFYFIQVIANIISEQRERGTSHAFSINKEKFQENQATYGIYQVDHRLCEVVGMRVGRAMLLILERKKINSHYQILTNAMSRDLCGTLETCLKRSEIGLCHIGDSVAFFLLLSLQPKPRQQNCKTLKLSQGLKEPTKVCLETLSLEVNL